MINRFVGSALRALRNAGTASKAARPRPYALPEHDGTRARQRLERILIQNVVPFWDARAVDREFGGYRFNHDAEGRWLGPDWKTTANQARMLVFYAQLCRSPYATPSALDAARHGFEILDRVLWDTTHGGFLWAVDHTTERVLVPDKHLVAQAYGLYALGEYHRATGDQRALALADQTFRIVESNMRDDVHGGYREGFNRDWTPQSIFRRNPMAAGPYVKSMSAHMNMLTALRVHCVATGNARARERLQELLLIQTNAVASKRVATSSSHYREDWRAMDPEHDGARYFDHDLKNIWQVAAACEVLGISPWIVADLWRAQFRNAMKHGWDPVHGGFFTPPRFKHPGTVREKDWWTQAEGLVAALRLFRALEDEEYWKVFQRTLDWIEHHQVDWTHGEWHAFVTETGATRGNKAGRWKTGYHTGRALLTCLELLA